MKGSKGLYVFSIGEYEDTDSLRIQIGGEVVYIPMRDIYGAAERHKKEIAALSQIAAMPEEKRMVKSDKEEELSDVLASIARRLDALEAHFTPAGLDILTGIIDQRLAVKIRQQLGR